jgi:U32 family peptidase
MPKTKPAPELLAPAGDWDCIRAAVENGADAVYFGLEDGFNARARATNFDLNNIVEIMLFLHRRGVKGYVTLNTLAFSDELPKLQTIIRRLALASVDAVLVQDLGVARMIREITHDLAIHASTQMTLTSAECIAVAEQLGIKRVVLPRELSIDEIRQIHSKTGVELEAFVHGALCVAYSGQCLTSESLGGRSANRGQCAQACRLPYELLCDGELQDYGDQKYLLSPQDLAAFALTEQLIEAGIRCFKIEGRLKTPEYVANITRHYREAIDSAMAGEPVEFSQRQIQQMEQSFSRGFSPGWLNGCDHKMLVPATSSAKRGVLLGRIVAVHFDRVTVELDYTVQAGDGVVFDGDRANNDEQGGRVFQVFQNRLAVSEAIDCGMVDLTFDRSNVELSRLYVGQQVWKTDDPRLTQQLRRTYETADPQRRVPLILTVHAEPGRPLLIEGIAKNGCLCRIESEQPLEVAQKHPITVDVLREQLSRLGGSAFELLDLNATIVGTPMVPLSVLGKLRKQMIEQLDNSLPMPEVVLCRDNALERLRNELPAREFLTAVASDDQQKTIDKGKVAGTLRVSQQIADGTLSVPATLTVLCRTLDQVRACVDLNVDRLNVDRLIADFQDIREYREAVQIARSSDNTLLLATPRIQKPDEMGLFRAMLKHQPDGVLIRNLSGLAFFRANGVAVVGDYSLNVTNELTASFLMEQKLQWLTPSYDLNRDQLMDLVKAVPPQWLEVVVHQHMPMFHMEHCVFCAMLSPGTNKTNCGRPCDVHQVELRDRTGVDHPLVADVGCRNTLFNAVAQSSAEVVAELLTSGVRRFRIELLRDDTDQIGRLYSLYTQLLHGSVTGEHVWRNLNAMNRVGVTRGTLESRRNPLAIL